MPSGTKENSNSFLLSHRTWILKQGKCLKCFLRGHKKKDYFRKIKCLLCNKGHTSKHCKLSFINAEPPNQTHRSTNTLFQRQQEAHVTNKDNPTPPHHLKQMENTPNWETMDLMDPDDLEVGRRESMRVFLPPRGPLRTVNSFLERSALVLAGPHQINRYMAHRLAVKLANSFNLEPRDFHISRVHQNYGDYIVRFPNASLRDHTVAICVFRLGPDVQLQLVEWSPGMGVLYDPLTHRARLRLYGLPLNNWNIHDLDILVSGFGHLLRVETFFTNGNHQEIRILVACFHPINIPKTLDLSEEPDTTIVQVVLEGWMHDGTADIPRDVSNIDDDTDPYGGPTQGRRRRHNTQQRPTPQGRHSVTDSNNARPRNHGRYGERQVQQQWQLEKSLEMVTTQSNGEIITEGEKETGQQKVTGNFPNEYNDLFCLLFKSLALYENSKESASIKWPVQDFTCLKFVGELCALVSPSNLANQFADLQGLSGIMDPFLKLAHLITTNKGLLLASHQAQPLQLEAQTGPMIMEIDQNQTQNLEIEITSSTVLPPGFEGPLATVDAVRKSSRLQQKHGGKYVSILQRAQRIKDNSANEVSFLPNKKKPRLESQVQPSYLEKLDPLTDYQAEAVVANAGVELEETLMGKIKTMAVMVQGGAQAEAVEA